LESGIALLQKTIAGGAWSVSTTTAATSPQARFCYRIGLRMTAICSLS